MEQFNEFRINNRIRPDKPKPKPKRKFFMYFLPVISAIAIVLAVYFYFELNTLKNDDGIKNQKEITNLVEKVGEHMFLPEGEVPTMATVSDPETLKRQDFFKNAKIGDKVLIYTKAKQAILYDPVADKIITIAPLSLDDSSTQNRILEKKDEFIPEGEF